MRLFEITRGHRRRHKSRGQSLVEFAIILPIMMVFLAAVLDLGRVFYATVSLNNAARVGAFPAAQTPQSFTPGGTCTPSAADEDDRNLVICRVQLESKDSAVSIPSSAISMSCSTGCVAQAGSTVTVRVTGQFTLLTPLLATVLGGQTIPMSASATAQLEYLPTPATATMPPAPVAVFSVSPSSGTAPLSVSFDGTGSSGSPTDWQWDFGDGNTAVGSATTNHTYTSAGTYTVTLTAINLAGSDSATHTVTVTAAPTATATSTSTATATATAAPTCAYPPNVIGQAPGTAVSNLNAAGFVAVALGDLTSGQKGKIQAQNPDHTQCKDLGTTITIHYRPN